MKYDIYTSVGMSLFRNSQILPGGTSSAGVDHYFPFIDGMRAIAVLSVVLFHAGVPGFSGGFIGVDIFFVISGFLIIGIITRDLKAGRFSFWKFYARRTLRILPPFFLVLLVSTLIGFFLLVVPTEIQAFGESVIWSVLMGANFHYLMQEGYFDVAAETKPLLNMWSLAVEEQFYLLVPFILFCAMWIRSALIVRILLGLLALASLAACVYFTNEDRNYSFYLTPLRAWQFVAGGCVVLLLSYVNRFHWLPSALGFIGLVFIAISVTTYDLSITYPSHHAILPVAGAVALLLSGMANPGGSVGALLATPLLRFIGLVSYSWYLWHWPLLSFYRIAKGGQSTLFSDLVLVAVALLLAILTYLLLERPIAERKHLILKSAWRPALTTTAGIVVAAGIGGMSYAASPVAVQSAQTHVTPEIWPESLRRRDLERGDPCFLRRDGSLNAACKAGRGPEPVVLLAGDSHAAMWYPLLANLAETARANLVTQYANGCRPYLAGSSSRRCNEYFDISNRSIQEGLGQRVDFAIITGAWNRDIYGAGWEADFSQATAERRQSHMQKALSSSIEHLKSRGASRILVIGPVPEFAAEVPVCLLRAVRMNISWDICAVPRATVDARRAVSTSVIMETLSGMTGVRYLDPIGTFCDQEKCRPFKSNQSLYSDSHHITRTATDLILEHHRDDFGWVFGTIMQPDTAALD